jgi:DNA mismatch repair protein MutS2
MARSRKKLRPMAPVPRASRDREIDLHGMIVDEALMRLAEEIDACARYREEYLRVNHGKGSGTLRLAVRDMLAHHALVIRQFPAQPNAGGDGVTVLQLSV